MAAKDTVNEEIRINLPVRWVAGLAALLIPMMGVTWYSAGSQADVVERGILVHSQEKHRGAANAADMQRVQFVQEDLERDVHDLHALVADLTESMQELIIELRTQRVAE